MMQVAFRVDASEEIGTGHLMRCMTLADELKQRGTGTCFICREITPFLSAKLRGSGHTLITLAPAAPSKRDDLAHAHWLNASQDQDARGTAAALRGSRCDWLVVDHYALDARWEHALRTAAGKILTLDDLADRAHDCDILVDQNLQLTPESRYDGLVPSACRRLEGPVFALLRPEFRDTAAQAPAKAQGLPRLNVFFGGTDPNGMTIKALEAIAGLCNRAFAVDFVVGHDNPLRHDLERRCTTLENAKMYVQPPSMALLFAQASLALGAGGSTSWERCCLGLPTIIVSIAENQKSGARALAAARAAIDLGPMSAISNRFLGSVVENVFQRPRLVRSMSLRASSLVDGKGAGRVAEAMTCA